MKLYHTEIWSYGTTPRDVHKLISEFDGYTRVNNPRLVLITEYVQKLYVSFGISE